MSTTCANRLVTSLAIVCFQFCPIEWFLLLQSVNKYWFLIGSTLSPSRKCLTFDDTWRQSSETNTDFLSTHPKYRELMQLNLKAIISEADFSMVHSFSCLKTVTLDFAPQFNFEPHHLFPASLESLSLDICEIDNIKHLSLSSTTHPKLHTVNFWFYQERDYEDEDKTLVESILLPLGNLTSLHLQSSRRFTGWIDTDVVRIVQHLQQLKKFQTNFIFSRPALWDLNHMLSEDFNLTLAAPRGYSPHEQEWFVNIKQLLHEQPNRSKHWIVTSFYSDLRPTTKSETCFTGFQRIVEYLPLVCMPQRDECAVMPSRYFESIEQWNRLAQCRKLHEIVLVFETPLLLTLSHIQALRPVYHQLTYFQLKTVQLSVNTFTMLKQEIRLNIKGLLGCEEPLQNVHFLCPCRERELLVKK